MQTSQKENSELRNAERFTFDAECRARGLPDIFAPGITSDVEQMRGHAGIYRITSPSGRLYFGQAQDLSARRRQHRWGSHNNILRASIVKYGPEAHRFEVLEFVDDIAALDECEQGYLTAAFAAKNSGVARLMNASPTASSMRGYRFTDEQRAKLSASAKVTQGRPDVKAKKSASSKAAYSRAEIRAKLSASIKSTLARPEVRAKRSAAMKAAYSCPDFRAKMISSLKAALAQPEARAKRSAISKAVHARPDVRAKMSASIKAAYAHPEVKARKSASSKAALAHPEVRAKMSASIKAARARPEVKAKLAAAAERRRAEKLASMPEGERAAYEKACVRRNEWYARKKAAQKPQRESFMLTVYRIEGGKLVPHETKLVYVAEAA